MRRSIAALSFIAVFAAASIAGAQTAPPTTADQPAPPPTTEEAPPPPPAKTKLTVYTKPIEPFSFQKDDRAVGFSIELWQRIAAELGVQYDLVWVKSVGEVIDAVKSGKGDV